MTSVALALCLARTLGTGSPSRKGRSMKNGGFFGFGDHAAAEASIANVANGCDFTSSSVLSASTFFIVSTIAGVAGAARLHATGTQRVNARKDIRAFHPQAHRSISAHRVSGKPATCRAAQRAVMRVNVRDQLFGDESLPVADRDRVRIHTAFEPGE